MPLGNLTSQFFANVYLNELDYFVKHKLKCNCYIRDVDDFVILHKSKKQLEIWKTQIFQFLQDKLKLELHKDKSSIRILSRGIDFVGFRNFYKKRLIRKRSYRKMRARIKEFNKGNLSTDKFFECFQGWLANARWQEF
ncbi:MAG: RNA-directed DNA polymerase [Nanoarchaeota archaeon]